MFDIGTKVKIIEDGALYPNIVNWAKVHNLTAFKDFAAPKLTDTFLVVVRGYHEYGKQIGLLYGIQDDSGDQYIVGETDLTKYIPESVYEYQIYYFDKSNNHYRLSNFFYTEEEILLWNVNNPSKPHKPFLESKRLQG